MNAAGAQVAVKFDELSGEIKSAPWKEFVVSGFELTLSLSLSQSFFECPVEAMQDEQDLQTLYTMSWVPLFLSIFIAFGFRLTCIPEKFRPSRQNFDINLRRSKILTWIAAFIFLINDPDMQFKDGPGLKVAAIFCVCDLARFEMEIHRLIEDEEELQQEDGHAQMTTARAHGLDFDIVPKFGKKSGNAQAAPDVEAGQEQTNKGGQQPKGSFVYEL